MKKRAGIKSLLGAALFASVLGSGVSAAESFDGVEIPPVEINGGKKQPEILSGRGEGNGKVEVVSIPAASKQSDSNAGTLPSGGKSGVGVKTSGAVHYVDEVRKARGIDIKKTGRAGKAADDRRAAKNTNFMDSVIWVDTFSMITNGFAWDPTINPSGKEEIAMAHLGDEYEKMIAENEKRLKAEKKERSEKKAAAPRYYAGGYCDVSTTVYITRSNEFASLDCLLNFGEAGFRSVNVFMGLYPDYKREILIGLPVYLTFENGKRASFDGVVLNQRKTSLNIASWIDSRKIQQMLAESALSANDIAYRYASSYISALQESKRNEQLSYVYVDSNNSNGGTTVPIQTTNTEKPKPSEYLIGAGIEFLSNIVSMVGRNFLESTTPLYRIDRGSRVYVEGVVSFDNEGLAKKFGLIEKVEQQKAKQNNDRWQSEKDRLIQSYGRRGSSGGIINAVGK